MLRNQSWRLAALAIAAVLFLLARQESNQAQPSDAPIVSIGSPATTADNWVSAPRFDRSQLQLVSLETLPEELQEPETQLPEPPPAVSPQFVTTTSAGCGCGCEDCTCDLATTTYTTTTRTYVSDGPIVSGRLLVRVRDRDRQPVRNIIRGCGRLMKKVGQRVRPRGEVIRVRYRSGTLLQSGCSAVGCG